MASSNSSNSRNFSLAEQARALFMERAARVVPILVHTIFESLSALAALPGGARDLQERRDAVQAYQKHKLQWQRGVIDAFTKALSAPVTGTHGGLGGLTGLGKLELMGDEVVENRILSSRLALRMLDFASWELNDLRLRIQNLEGVSELRKQDIFRPEVLAQHLVEQWTAAGLPQQVWTMVQDVIQKSMAEQMLEVYHATNEFLIQRGVMAEIDLRPLVRRTPSAVATNSGPSSFAESQASTALDQRQQRMVQGSGAMPMSGMASPSMRNHLQDDRNSQPTQNTQSGYAREDGGRIHGQAPASVQPMDAGNVNARTARNSWVNGVHDETRMQTESSPLARVRMRAQGVMGHLRRLISSHVSDFDQIRPNPASPQLAQALVRVQSVQAQGMESTLLADAQGQIYDQGHVNQALGDLRKRTHTLKQAASTSAEKATIEVVALMFQSILAEDRIPPGIRVWFARLQMPVLKVALAEPEFFSSLQHPARRLIDRMGSCVLGFDVTIGGGILESEIKRVVQVIEQYPETGRRVFELVYGEFDKFLARFLAEQGSTARVVSVAQQIEQKETMVIQYTIEMRKMLNDIPVCEEIREFLFKIWAEVLALTTLKNGPQHAETLTLKQAAADLVWAASAKPNREDRARVIADLPNLLQLLRRGMSLLGLDLAEQDGHIKIVSSKLADAFLSKTNAIAREQVDAMAQHLAHLENYLSDQDVGDLPLDMNSLVTMIGIDVTDIEVIADGGSQPTDAMCAWARELQLGSWHSLDHNGKVSHVQFAWCSERKQLHLFATADGRNFLIQARRLAAYLQAGLLLPTEEESLTIRATRDALVRLDANPERLLGAA